MDIEKLIEQLRYLADTPSYTAFHDAKEREIICDQCEADFCYDKQQDAHWCMYEALSRAATALSTLRAENEQLRAELEQVKNERDSTALAKTAWPEGGLKMAQLYKMTLYVCDLGENLSLDEIKRLINDDALDGIATSCITHYANERVGPKIEWDDDIDLNYTNSTTEQWERYFKEDWP